LSLIGVEIIVNWTLNSDYRLSHDGKENANVVLIHAGQPGAEKNAKSNEIYGISGLKSRFCDAILATI
jgi:hypothetical protein